MAGLEDGGECLHKGRERVVDLVTKVVMDRSVLPLDLGDDLTEGGSEPGGPLGGAAGHVVVQMRHRVRQGPFQVLHGRDLLRDFAQVVAFRGQGEGLPEHGGTTRENTAEKLQVGRALGGHELPQTRYGKTYQPFLDLQH